MASFPASRAWWVVVVAGATALVLALASYRATMRAPTDVTRADPSAKPQAIAFPYSATDVPTHRPIDFAFHVRKSVFTPRSFVIQPDDHFVSISVGGRALSLDAVDPKKLDDYQAGFSFPLGQALARGDNLVVVRIVNGGGPEGLDVRADGVDPRCEAELAAAVLAGLVLLVAAMSRAGARLSTVLVAVVGVAVRLAYLCVTSFNTRSHDAPEHLDYVRYLVEHHALPKAADGYAFYHPPLYYLSAALAKWGLGAAGFGWGEVVVALQLLSVAYELGFAAFAIATARLWIDAMPDAQIGRGVWSRDGLAALCAALILWWPSSVMDSVRVGNDDLTYLWFGGAMYFASRWWLRDRDATPGDFHRAAAFAAAGVLTKTNTLIVFAVLGVLLLARFVRDRERRPAAIARYAGPLAALLVTSAGFALRGSIAAKMAGATTNLIVANAQMNSGNLVVGNRADNYMWFDVRTFVTAAFTSAWDDAKGRQYFWNYLLKTSLFGEWDFAHPWAWNLAVVLSVLCLGMLAILAAGTVVRGAREWLHELPLFALAILSVAGLASLRMKIPSSCSGDFRYVLPILMPLAFWYVRALAARKERGLARTAWAGLAAGWVFAGLSVAFVATVVWTAPR